jgi:hypothetical protein
MSVFILIMFCVPGLLLRLDLLEPNLRDKFAWNYNSSFRPWGSASTARI